MDDDHNPYAPPAPPAPEAHEDRTDDDERGAQPLPDAVLRPLRLAQPWIKACAVGLAVVALLGAILLSTLALGRLGVPMGPLRGIASLALGVLAVSPGLLLWQYATSLDIVFARRSVDALSYANERQWRGWRSLGAVVATMLAVGLILYVSKP